MVFTLSDVNLQCRLCFTLTENEKLTLFFKPLQDGLILSELFKSISGYDIEEDGTAPEKICDVCASTIVEFNNLLVQFHENENHLKTLNRFKNDVYTEEIIIKHENSSPNIQQLNKHLITDKIIQETTVDYHIESFKYSCDKCGDVFLHKTAFIAHYFTKHDVRLDDDKIVSFVSKIKIKMPKVTPDSATLLPQKIDRLKCKICDETFPCLTTLKSHENIHKKHVCEHCGAIFLKKAYLRDHITKHSKTGEFICKICGKALKHRVGFLRHKRLHSNVRDHVCDICGQKFKEKQTLLTHIKLKHSTGEKNYSCSDCGLKFKLKCWRDKHFKRRHTERTREFTCKECGVGYLNKCTLDKHSREKHSGMVEIFDCEICGKNFATKGNRTKHFGNVHQMRCDPK